jgi:oligoendopeptidase F
MNTSIKLYQAETASLPVRGKIEDRYKWDLNDVYESDEKWEEDFKWVEENIPLYKTFEGALGLSDENLLKCLEFDNRIGTKIQRLHLYVMLSKDSDLRVTKYLGMDDRIKGLISKASAESSFIHPELIAMPDEKLRALVDKNEKLQVYNHYFDNLLRKKLHTLSKQEEEILALSSEVNSVSYNTYSIFTNSDLKFPAITDEHGHESEMSHARYYAALTSKNREYRRDAFKAYYQPYKSYINTLTSLFNGNLKSKIFHAKARKYKSAREAALNRNNIPIAVYDNLINNVNQNLTPLHRWAGLKKRILGLDELHPYDVYVTIFANAEETKYSYDNSVQLVYDALKPLGEEYLKTLQMAFDNRWIDVYETQSKRSGAYSSGTTFGVHPYVLLNWTDLLNDVFTLAHEMGHNMHSYYTGVTQPYPYANYTIFLAEVASTFNESLLLDYLIGKSETKEEKLYLLEKYLNNITSTFYRQTMFAEFEMMIYEMTEKGKALTTDVLRELYKNIYQKYWGPEMIIDEEEEYTWARIPHFYYNFYVYQYATGFAASEILSKKVKEEGQPAIDKYLSFLKSGSSDYSINLLNKAGVDMKSADPIIATTQKMNSLLDEVEDLI